MKKWSVFLILVFLITGITFAQRNKGPALEQYARVKFKVETSGDITYGKNENYSQINVAAILSELHNSGNGFNYYSLSFNYIGCSTIYDYVSNATPCNIVQDPNNANRIHIVCNYSPWGDPHPNFPGRQIKYYYSTNKGTSWSFINNIGPRGGFSQIILMSNGNALISGNFGSGITETAKWYYDAAPGLGSFTEIYPSPPIYQYYLFPRTIPTISISDSVKFISVVSSSDLDSAFRFSCISLNPSPGTFSPLNFINAKPAECYFLARGEDGRIGIVYIANNLLQPADIGDVYFMESTDNGTSFSNPTKIFDANISPSGDSLGAFRGISMVYQNNSPKVVFETVKQTTNGYYFPGAPSNIRFWSNTLPGSDPNRSIVIVDTSDVGFHPYICKGTNNDLFAPICRPTIGKSTSGNFLYLVFIVPSNLVGGFSDTSSYMNLWLSYSPSSGNTLWFTPQKINPDTGSFKDWTYPSISFVNDFYSPHYYANIVVLGDSIPGSYINHPLNGQSYAKYFFVRADIYHNINPPDPPTVPVLNLPVNGSTNVLLNPTLDWSAAYADSYHVQVSLTQTFNTVVVDTGLTLSQYTIQIGRLNTNTIYFWRVRSYSYYWGYTPWSNVWHFTTRSTGINTIGSEIPKEYKLYQNYPNPFNPLTMLRFDLPKTSNVKIIIYDMLGREVAIPLNEKLNAGTYEASFDGSKLSSGIYFYKLETESFKDIKKMVLIK